MKETMLLQALSMDLLRTAVGFHRGSLAMAQTFNKEALQKLDQLKNTNNIYIRKLVNSTKPYCSLDKKENADQLLMYSVLFQNAAQMDLTSR